MRRFLSVLLLTASLAFPLAAQTASGSLVLSTTTSVQITGLLDVLLPAFQEATGIQVRPIAVGTGKAFELARNGDADAVLAHSRALEDRFIADGFGTNAWDLMYNDFLLLGPAGDPAGAATARSAGEAFQAIASSGQPFASRGDQSGTHQRELDLWQAAGTRPAGAAYLETGQGMAETLQLAFEKKGYTLCDRATWLFMRQKLPLAVIYENPAELKNSYAIMAVSQEKVPTAKTGLANRLVAWVTGPEGQQIIASFTIDGEPLFHLSVGKR
ncbi:MAG: solute-binding protein [Candidatus Riflebacteria bacterium]|nr:solute-binding protein [Candidatus Riflebacteria bacterium]